MRRHAPAVVLGALLAGLALATPIVNAAAGPPRALFLRLPPDRPEPVLGLRAERDGAGEWLLRIAASDFAFTDLCVVEAEATPRGHAHILRDGVKVASAYQPVVHLGALPAGTHRIRVVLRAQDHRALVGRNGLIAAEIVISEAGRS